MAQLFLTTQIAKRKFEKLMERRFNKALTCVKVQVDLMGNKSFEQLIIVSDENINLMF